MNSQQAEPKSPGSILSKWLNRISAVYSNYGTVILAAAALLAGVIFGLFNITSAIEENAVSRHILASAGPVEEQRIVVVMCTDDTIEKLAPDTGWPIERTYYTQLLQNAFAGAQTVVFDILFADNEDPSGDQEFADAVSAHGGVVLARSNTTLPFDSLFYSGARIGYAIEFNENDADAVSRRYKLYVNSDLRTGPTLICSALLSQGYTVSYNGRNAYLITSPDGQSVRLNVDSEGYFYRVPMQLGADVQVLDLYDVYTGNYEQGLFDGAVVFVGGTVAGFEDIVFAPDFASDAYYSGGSVAMRVVGTKYLADCYATVLSGFSPVSASGLVRGIICTLIFLLTAILSLRLSVRYNWLVPVAVLNGWFWLVRLLFVLNLCCLPTVSPIISSAVAYLMVLIIRLALTSRERMVSSLPIETLYNLVYRLDASDVGVSFEEYMENIGDDVFRQLDVTVISPRTASPGVSAAAWDKGSSGTAVIRSRAVAAQYGTKALIVIPLPSFEDEEKTYTVLGSDRRTPSHFVQSVTALVLAVYVYYEAQQQSEEKQRLAMSMVSVIIQMIDAKDPVTAGHSRRVAGYSRQIAEWLGYDSRRAGDVEFAALLHDIGKIGVADAVLNKPGLFTSDDFTHMRSHPALGADIVRTMGLSDDIVDGVLHHHERLDGRGYPDGKVGGDFARIIKVADVFDALTSQRQYKSAWGTQKALEVISSGIGSEFDGEIAGVFINNYAPSGDDSSAEEEGSGGSAELRSVEFAVRLREQVAGAIDRRLDSMSVHEELFDFDCSRCFAGQEWGERFSSPASLRHMPDILQYNTENGSVTAALAGHPEDTVQSCVFYYHKGCLSAGLVSLKSGTDAGVLKRLTDTYGAPVSRCGCKLWQAGNHFVVMVKESGQVAFAYITRYLTREM